MDISDFGTAVFGIILVASIILKIVFSIKGKIEDKQRTAQMKKQAEELKKEWADESFGPNTDLNSNDEEYIRNHHLNESYQERMRRIWQEEQLRKQQEAEEQRRTAEAYQKALEQKRLAKYYAILGVPASADSETIKHTYRIMMKKYHPDNILKPDTPEDIKEMVNQRFIKIQEAYKAICEARHII
jgi:hypothetical protein